MIGPMAIGAMAEHSGVKAPTIRYYEQVGLLPPPPRSEGRRRVYGADDLRRLQFIRHARELGFSVEAIRTLLRLQEDPEQNCSGADAIARLRLQEVDERIARLQALRAELQRMLHACASGRVAECRVIETLAHADHDHGKLDEAYREQS